MVSSLKHDARAVDPAGRGPEPDTNQAGKACKTGSV